MRVTSILLSKGFGPYYKGTTSLVSLKAVARRRFPLLSTAVVVVVCSLCLSAPRAPPRSPRACRARSSRRVLLWVWVWAPGARVPSRALKGRAAVRVGAVVVPASRRPRCCSAGVVARPARGACLSPVREYGTC